MLCGIDVEYYVLSVFLCEWERVRVKFSVATWIKYKITSYFIIIIKANTYTHTHKPNPTFEEDEEEQVRSTANVFV